jgi:hypothetical protein
MSTTPVLIEPRRYQTNTSLSQPPTMGADRPVREYVTNISCAGEPVRRRIGQARRRQ